MGKFSLHYFFLSIAHDAALRKIASVFRYNYYHITLTSIANLFIAIVGLQLWIQHQRLIIWYLGTMAKGYCGSTTTVNSGHFLE